MLSHNRRNDIISTQVGCKHRKKVFCNVDNGEDVTFYAMKDVGDGPNDVSGIDHLRKTQYVYIAKIMQETYVSSGSTKSFEFKMGLYISNQNVYVEIKYCGDQPGPNGSLALSRHFSPIDDAVQIIYPEETVCMCVDVINTSLMSVKIRSDEPSFFALIRFVQFADLNNVNVICLSKKRKKIDDDDDREDEGYENEDDGDDGGWYDNTDQYDNDDEEDDGVSSTCSLKDSVMRETFFVYPNGIPPNITENSLAYKLFLPDDLELRPGQRECVFLRIYLSLPQNNYAILSIDQSYQTYLSIDNFSLNNMNGYIEDDRNDLKTYVKNISPTRIKLKRGDGIVNMQICRKPCSLGIEFINE